MQLTARTCSTAVTDWIIAAAGILGGIGMVKFIASFASKLFSSG